MKTLLSMLITVFFISGLFAQPVEKTRLNWTTPYTDFPESLNGKIKEIKQRIYLAVDNSGKIEKGAPVDFKFREGKHIVWRDCNMFFDEMGNILRTDYLKENDGYDMSYLNEIRNGRVVKENWVMGNTQAFGEAFFYYNDKNNLREIDYHLFEKPDEYVKLILSNDEAGNTIRMDVIQKANVLTQYGETKWDSNNRVITSYSYDSEGKLNNTLEFAYNDHGFMSSIHQIAPGFDLTVSLEGYEYDTNGNWTKQIWKFTGMEVPPVVVERSYIYY